MMRFGAPPLRLLLVFVPCYLLLLLFARSRSSDDPTSVFFDPAYGYRPRYSATRLQQAYHYLDDGFRDPNHAPRPKPNPHPELCIGISSVARQGTQYLKGAVGSLLQGLSSDERGNIHLILLIAHTDPWQHPLYAEPWLHELPDQLLVYNASNVDLDHVRGMETAEERQFARQKAIFDYTFVLEACKETGTPYVAMIEDDVVAQDGWYHHTMEALASIEEQTGRRNQSPWLYLRLFFTEGFLGWNAEEWPAYLFLSVLTVGGVACLLLGARSYHPPLRASLANHTVLFICGVCTPLLIGLFFAAGRVTTMPFPPGVREMPKFGCCSQGFVFPQSRVPELLALYKERRVGYVDMLTEEYANAHDEVRWAVVPPVLQHVGRKSSKETFAKEGESEKVTGVGELWNFAFERLDPGELAREHEVHL